jgi:PAS domain S-box-containing protein
VGVRRRDRQRRELAGAEPAWLGFPADAEPSTEELRARYCPGERERLQAEVAEALARGERRFQGEYRFARLDGSVRWLLLRCDVALDAQGKPTSAVGVLLNITERKQAEAALRRLNETLEERVAERTADRDRMWRLSTDVMLVARFDATIVSVNPAWTTLLGWIEGDLLGTRFMDLVHPDDRAATLNEISRLSRGLTTLRFENRYRRKDGAHRWLSWTAVPDESFIHAIGRDVSAEKEAAAELERAQEALRQAQKMEAVGQLTGGVAHDFNNLLQALASCLQLVERRAGPSAPAVQPLVEVGRQAVERGAKLVQQLMAFARRQALRPEPVDVRDRVLGMSELLAARCAATSPWRPGSRRISGRCSRTPRSSSSR